MKCRVTLKRSIKELARFWVRPVVKGEKREEKETDHIVSSYGSWPGHEADYTALNRLLWHVGRSKTKC